MSKYTWMLLYIDLMMIRIKLQNLDKFKCEIMKKGKPQILQCANSGYFQLHFT